MKMLIAGAAVVLALVLCFPLLAAGEKSGERNVAVFLYDGVELLDFGGPGEVFAATDGFNVYTVAATTDPVVSQGFLRVTPEHTIDDSPSPDILILPGGATGGPLRDEKVIEWIRAGADDLEVALSVCTGAFLLAKAGLLDGLSHHVAWRDRQAPRGRAAHDGAREHAVGRQRHDRDHGRSVGGDRRCAARRRTAEGRGSRSAHGALHGVRQVGAGAGYRGAGHAELA